MCDGWQARWEGLGVSRRYQGVALALTLLLLAYYSSWSTRVLTVFVGLIVVRANLKTSEVSRLGWLSWNFTPTFIPAFPLCSAWQAEHCRQWARLSLDSIEGDFDFVLSIIPAPSSLPTFSPIAKKILQNLNGSNVLVTTNKQSMTLAGGFGNASCPLLSVLPLQVETIAARTNKTCAPYINSAKKQGRRLSMVASDFVRRSSFGASKIHHK